MLHAERCERENNGEKEREVQEEKAAKRNERQGKARQDKAGSPEPVKGRENNVDMCMCVGGGRGEIDREGIYKSCGRE